MKNQSKKNQDRTFIIGEMLSLIFGSVVFIIVSIIVSGWYQSLFISIGTGLLASAIVSYAFWRMQNEKEIRFSNKCRDMFMSRYKILVYKIISDINMAFCKDVRLTLSEYIKAQHRWFHEYYKRMVADNVSVADTNIRVKQIVDFISKYKLEFSMVFNGRLIWEEGSFSERQLDELGNLYGEFCESEEYVANKNYKEAFLSFAGFLEILKRVITEDNFTELQNFDLLEFNYDANGKMEKIENAFENKEEMFSFAKQFNKIRCENYKKYYGKEDGKENGNGQA